jgi:hypothetical protein
MRGLPNSLKYLEKTALNAEGNDALGESTTRTSTRPWSHGGREGAQN